MQPQNAAKAGTGVSGPDLRIPNRLASAIGNEAYNERHAARQRLSRLDAFATWRDNFLDRIDRAKQKPPAPVEAQMRWPPDIDEGPADTNGRAFENYDHAGELMFEEVKQTNPQDQAFFRLGDQIFAAMVRLAEQRALERDFRRQPPDYGASEELLMRRARRIARMAREFRGRSRNEWLELVAIRFPEASLMQQNLARKLATQWGIAEGTP